MMPELGKYAATVLSAYGVSVVLLLLLVGASIWRAKQVRGQLEQIEQRMKQDG
ncbi:Heme exporter protein D (CcmD) [Roseovarius albus]|uniref:Heme exporter protein D n=1 Tax=Roseovarius albus TaxID=1247867 RepID=A0A1X6YAD3_9RHOB|nr:heme exporter protein CcmD [Roseovarius albus]SLN15451.1 Heme exporter protein D (CcmD) [Roseovarius albus]